MIQENMLNNPLTYHNGLMIYILYCKTNAITYIISKYTLKFLIYIITITSLSLYTNNCNSSKHYREITLENKRHTSLILQGPHKPFLNINLDYGDLLGII